MVRVAMRHRRTPREATALYLGDLGLSLHFPHVFFRPSSSGREARVRGTGLAVWELVRLIRGFDGDIDAVAAHLEIDPALVAEAQAYASQRPREIERALDYHESFTLERLQALLPDLHVFSVDDERP
jgi:uncharacterized protein (DUF433 family)